MAVLVNNTPPCVLHEDEHLLVVNKPTGLNTHSPSPFRREKGFYEWLRHREQRWADLAIIHRLDKETSGVLVFWKDRSGEPFIDPAIPRNVRYENDICSSQIEGSPQRSRKSVQALGAKPGEKYQSRPVHAGAEIAETRFEVIKSTGGRNVDRRGNQSLEKTHQIRVHAAERGFPDF